MSTVQSDPLFASGAASVDRFEGHSAGRRPVSTGSSGQARINVPTVERWGSAILGGALAAHGLRHPSLSGLLLAVAGGALVQRGFSGHCHVYAALNVNRAAGPGARPTDYFEHGVHVEQTISINRPAKELYAFWRKLENLPLIMTHLRSVEVIDDKRSSWTAVGPGGVSVGWEAQIISDVPDESLAWRSLRPASVDNAGSVRFVELPGDRGTEVRVTLDYIPPAGLAGRAAAKLLGADPNSTVRDDLRRFKAIMEAGEVPTIKGQAHGQRSKLGSLLIEG